LLAAHEINNDGHLMNLWELLSFEEDDTESNSFKDSIHPGEKQYKIKTMSLFNFLSYLQGLEDIVDKRFQKPIHQKMDDTYLRPYSEEANQLAQEF